MRRQTWSDEADYRHQRRGTGPEQHDSGCMRRQTRSDEVDYRQQRRGTGPEQQITGISDVGQGRSNTTAVA